MKRLCSANKAHRGHAVAPLLERLSSGSLNARIVSETKIIVSAEIDNGAPVFERHARALCTGNQSLLLKETRRADVGEFSFEQWLKIVVHNTG